MLRRVADGAAIVACSTCRASAEARRDAEGRTGGEQLIAALRSAASDADVAVQDMPCLFACSDSCAVHLRAPGKIGYVLGRFAPDADAARAILAFARTYARSEIGEVAYGDWPEGIKGHFLTRTPPPGFVVA